VTVSRRRRREISKGARPGFVGEELRILETYIGLPVKVERTSRCARKRCPVKRTKTGFCDDMIGEASFRNSHMRLCEMHVVFYHHTSRGGGGEQSRQKIILLKAVTDSAPYRHVIALNFRVLALNCRRPSRSGAPEKLKITRLEVPVEPQKGRRAPGSLVVDTRSYDSPPCLSNSLLADS
jgi:hypothetical protein